MDRLRVLRAIHGHCYRRVYAASVFGHRCEHSDCSHDPVIVTGTFWMSKGGLKPQGAAEGQFGLD